MQFSASVIELIKRRRSVRNFIAEELSRDLEIRIRQLLARHTTGPMGNRVTFHLVDKDFSKEAKGVRLGTYGFIKGARYFVAGEAGAGPFTEEDYGYLLETVILHLTGMDLGTCWLGGTFSRSEFAEIIQPSPGSVIPAVTPVGHPAPAMSTREQLIRMGAKSDQRKPWTALFFDDQLNNPISREAAGNLSIPLEMVRIAPSASNKQPWRIVRKGDAFHFCLSRTAGYGGVFKGVDLQRIDIGIAMAHFEHSSSELGVKGDWKVMDHGMALPGGVQYVISRVTKPVLK
jgi:nitroreductase